MLKNNLSLFFQKKQTIYGLWIFACLFASLQPYFDSQNFYDRINNYLIFKTSFWHLIHQQNLYLNYPKQYFDLYLYGPTFAIFMAPFAYLPTVVGLVFWNLLNSLLLLAAIMKIPNINYKSQVIISYICLVNMHTSVVNEQFHGITTALIIFTYIFLVQEKDFWAAFCIVFGLYSKIYGIVAISLFFFSKNKLHLILSGFFWLAMLFVLPMFFTNQNYVFQTYQDWFSTLNYKNSHNIDLTNMYQDLSVMGMIRRISGNALLPNTYFILPAVIIFALNYLKLKFFSNLKYQMLLLSSSLLLIILASSGTEASTMLIGVAGVGIWYVNSDKTKLDNILLILVLVFTALGPTGILPSSVNHGFLRKYAMMILPLFLVWLKIEWDILNLKKSEISSKSIG